MSVGDVSKEERSKDILLLDTFSTTTKSLDETPATPNDGEYNTVSIK